MHALLCRLFHRERWQFVDGPSTELKLIRSRLTWTYRCALCGKLREQVKNRWY